MNIFPFFISVNEIRIDLLIVDVEVREENINLLLALVKALAKV